MTDTASKLFPTEKVAYEPAPIPDRIDGQPEPAKSFADEARQKAQQKLKETIGDPPAENPPQEAGENQVDEPDKVPAAYSDYDLSMIENADPGITEWYKKTAYEHGLTRKQAAEMAVKYDAMVQEQQRTALSRYQAEADRLDVHLTGWDQQNGFDRNARIEVAEVEKMLPGFGQFLKHEALQGNRMVARLVHLAMKGQPKASGNSVSMAEKLFPQR